jgi:hypothetical protein
MPRKDIQPKYFEEAKNSQGAKVVLNNSTLNSLKKMRNWNKPKKILKLKKQKMLKKKPLLNNL